jgi:hypothetical protein
VIYLQNDIAQAKSTDLINNFQSLENIHLNNSNPESFDIDTLEEDKVLESFTKLLGALDYIETDIKEIEVANEEDFARYQHQFLSGYYITIDMTDAHLRIVTEDKRAFVIDLNNIPSKVYSLIFKVHLPRKICLDSKSLYKKNLEIFNSIYDISHIATMFCNLREFDLKKFVVAFKPKANNDINTLLYNLHDIKDKFNIIIEKNGLFPLVNKEFKLLEIIARCEENGLPFSKSEYLAFLDDIKTRYKKNEEMFKEVYGEEYSDKKSILKGLKNKGKILVLNESYLQEIEDSSLFGLAVVNRLYNIHNASTLKFTEDRLFLTYNPYNNYGQIEGTFDLDKFHIPFLKTNESKYYITGSYQNLFFRVFANFGRIDYLTRWANEKNLIPSLAEKVYGERYNNDKPLYEFYASSYLKGFMQGYFDPEDMMYYFFEELDFYMKEEEVEETANLFVQNCKEILDYIYNFNKKVSKDKRYAPIDNMPLYKFIRLTEADIFKTALLLVNENIENYNKRNKYQIKLVGLAYNTFILEADEGAYNIALDIVNRNLTKAYNKYIKHVPVLCSVSTGYKIIRG